MNSNEPMAARKLVALVEKECSSAFFGYASSGKAGENPVPGNKSGSSSSQTEPRGRAEEEALVWEGIEGKIRHYAEMYAGENIDKNSFSLFRDYFGSLYQVYSQKINEFAKGDFHRLGRAYQFSCNILSGAAGAALGGLVGYSAEGPTAVTEYACSAGIFMGLVEMYSGLLRNSFIQDYAKLCMRFSTRKQRSQLREKFISLLENTPDKKVQL